MGMHLYEVMLSWLTSIYQTLDYVHTHESGLIPLPRLAP